MTKRRIVSLVLALALLGVCAGVLGLRVVGAISATSAAEARVDAAEAAIETVASESAAKVDGAAASALGYDEARAESDFELVRKVAIALCSWDDAAAYGEARGAVADLGVAEDSQLLTTFMPPLEAIGSDGSTDVDLKGLFSSFRDCTVSLAGTDGEDGAYRYLAEVTCSTTDARGASADGSFLLWMTIAEDGSVQDAGAGALA